MPQADRDAIQKLMAEKLYARFAQQYPSTKPIFETIAAARRNA